jgi:proteasome lid subunit RPN8/RPN11
MQISQEFVDEMIAHAREELPNECCGMVEGVGGRAIAVHRITNEAASPLRYEMEGQERYRAWKAIEDAGNEFLAIYHSHTKSAAYPSQTDVNQAQNWPDQIYVIVSLADEDAPDVKAYLLKDLRIADVTLDLS